MDDTKPAQNASLPETHNPNPTPPAVPPPPPPPSPPPPPVHPPAVPFPQNGSRKRPLDATIQIQDCTYFQMRAVVKDIRPYILEILRTPDYRACKGVHELQEKLKLLMELCEQMKSGGAVSVTKRKTAPEEQPLSGDNGAAQIPKEQPQELAPEHGENQGKFIVGGSAFGWNFITFHGSKSIYYGRTKEAFRNNQASL